MKKALLLTGILSFMQFTSRDILSFFLIPFVSEYELQEALSPFRSGVQIDLIEVICNLLCILEA